MVQLNIYLIPIWRTWVMLITHNGTSLNKYLVPLYLFYLDKILEAEFVDKYIFKVLQIFFHIALQKTYTNLYRIAVFVILFLLHSKCKELIMLF